MVAQRAIDRRRRRTTVRVFCPCGHRDEVRREFIPDHDYYELVPAGRPAGPEISPDQARRLAELIKFIDQQEDPIV